MLLMEEKRLNKQIKSVAQHNSSSSSPTIMYAEPVQQNQQHSQQTNGGGYNNNNGGYNNNSGYNNNGNRGRGRGRGSRNNRGCGRNWPNQWNNNPWSFNQPLWMYPPSYNTPPPPSPYHYPAPSSYGGYSLPPTSLLGQPLHRRQSEAHYLHTSSAAPSIGPSASYAQSAHSGIYNAFSTMTLQDPSDSAWYMDTGATNHIATQPDTLRSLFNKNTISSVTVENVSFAPVTHTG